MEKRISYSQFQSVKCVAKACDPLITKRNKLGEKIKKLAAEFNDCNTQVDSLQAGIVAVIGLPVEKLVKKVIEPGVDVNGQPKKTTKYLPTDIVSYDEKHKQYVITTPDAEETPSEETNNEETAPSGENHMETPVQEPIADTTDETEDTPAEQEVEDKSNMVEPSNEMEVPSDANIFE